LSAKTVTNKMKAPQKGGGYSLDLFDKEFRVLVKSGPSPDYPYVRMDIGYDEDGEPIYMSMHIDEFHRRRIR